MQSLKNNGIRPIVSAITILVSFLLPTTVLATCCKCHPADDPGSNICLTISDANCPPNLANKYPKLAGLTCDSDTFQDADCKSVAENGVCKETGQAALYDASQSSRPTLAPSSQPALTVPKPGVEIPGLTFSSVPTVVKGSVVIPFIAQYIAAFYNYLVGVAIIVAAVMLVYGGFLYVVSATAGSVARGKEVIANALVGLALVLGAFTMLRLVSPPAASLKPLDIQVVKRDPMEDWYTVHGTADPTAPIPKPADIVPPSGVGPTPQGTAPAPGQPAPSAPTTGSVNVSDITYDPAAGGLANINKYCSSISEGKSATTYEQKQNLLAKAVLGFFNVCIQQHQCVYTQASATQIPSGAISGNPAPDFAADVLIKHTSLTPEAIWPNNPECIEAWKGPNGGAKVLSLDSKCRPPAAALYNEKINKVMASYKFFASDCVSFVIAAYGCAKAPMVSWNDGFGPAITAMVRKKEPPSKFLQKPQLIILTTLGDPDLESKVAQKGGVKFGDVFYVTGALHYYLYTGGRSDVPFTFIEMSGSPPGGDVPTIGHFGGMNIKTVTWQEDIKRKLEVTKVYPWPCEQRCGKGGGCKKCSEKDMIDSKPTYTKDNVLMIWRPFADTTPVATSTSP